MKRSVKMLSNPELFTDAILKFSFGLFQSICIVKNGENTFKIFLQISTAR